MVEGVSDDALRIDLRRRRMEHIVSAVMEELYHTVPSEFLEDIYNALCEVMHRNGAHIMTDKDRAEFGLEPRDGYGWTPSERVEAAARRRDIMLQMINIALPKEPTP